MARTEEDAYIAPEEAWITLSTDPPGMFVEVGMGSDVERPSRRAPRGLDTFHPYPSAQGEPVLTSPIDYHPYPSAHGDPKLGEYIFPLVSGDHVGVMRCDYEERHVLIGLKWNLKWNDQRKHGGRVYYAQARVAKRGPGSLVLAHRLLRPDWPIIDHVDGNGLNNTSRNLRPSNPSLNGANSSRKPRDLPRGVYAVKRKGETKYRAMISDGSRKLIVIGVFDHVEDAARAYDQHAKQRYGEHAKLNYPDEADSPALSRGEAALPRTPRQG